MGKLLGESEKPKKKAPHAECTCPRLKTGLLGHFGFAPVPLPKPAQTEVSFLTLDGLLLPGKKETEPEVQQKDTSPLPLERGES